MSCDRKPKSVFVRKTVILLGYTTIIMVSIFGSENLPFVRWQE